MKKVIQIDYKVVIISDYEGNDLENQISKIKEILETTDTKNGDLYEYDKDYTDNRKYVGEWVLVNIQQDLEDVDYKELRSYFVEYFNINRLGLELLDMIEETDEDKARNFIIEKFNRDFTQKEIVQIIYQIKN